MLREEEGKGGWRKKHSFYADATLDDDDARAKCAKRPCEGRGEEEEPKRPSYSTARVPRSGPADIKVRTKLVAMLLTKGP